MEILRNKKQCVRKDEKKSEKEEEKKGDGKMAKRSSVAGEKKTNASDRK